MVKRVLILAGTAEARSLAHRLSNHPELQVTASLAGVTCRPESYPVEIRTGGFGGAEGLATWLSRTRTAAVVNATHPYATQMQKNCAMACTKLEIPHLRLLRPAWPKRKGWICVSDLNAAADALPSGARVLVTSGRKEVAPLVERSDCVFVLRTIEPVEGLPPHMTGLIARPPFSLAQERETLASCQATHLISKNAGGAGVAKLDAADALRIAVIMVDRPRRPEGTVAESVDDAVAWVIRMVVN